MNERGFITATMHELERIKVIEAVCEHRLTMVRAAERLGLCERQISRLARRYAASGPAGLVSGKRGRTACVPRHSCCAIRRSRRTGG
jgi:Helix-turn-helix domain